MNRQAKVIVAAGAVLALGSGAAYANEPYGSSGAAQGQAGQSAAGEKGTAAAPGRSTAAATREMSGKVVQASPDKLYLEHMGAVVEFDIAPDARFSGANVHGSRDLAEGQEVRAAFTIENKTTNVAKQISVRSAGAPTRPESAPPAGAPGSKSQHEMGMPHEKQ